MTMPNDSFKERCARFVQRALSLVNMEFSKTDRALLEQFLQQFYAFIPAPDLEKMDPAQAAARAEDAYRYIRERKGAWPQIRIFSPRKDKNGWESRHWIVEILNEDMPFLVDSLSAELLRQGYTIYALIHPILHVKRSASGALAEFTAKGEAQSAKESFIHVEISPLPEGVSPAALEKELAHVLAYVRAAYRDWQKIVSQAELLIEELNHVPANVDATHVHEAQEFMRWLVDRNFIFLGYSDYVFESSNGRRLPKMVPQSMLGVTRLDEESGVTHGLEALHHANLDFLFELPILEIAQSNRKSVVHRPVHMDYIGVKRFDAQGNIIGHARFLGMFTSSVYYQSAAHIPLISNKLTQVMERSGFDPISHDGKALKSIFEFLPRDELLQMSEQELFDTSMGILSLEARPGVRLFIRQDLFGRFYSCMVFVPREYFSTPLRIKIQEILERGLEGKVSAYFTQITDAPLARLQLTILKNASGEQTYDIAALEAEIARVSYRWLDALREACEAQFGEQVAEKWIRQFGNAFSESYIHLYSVNEAVEDIQHIQKVLTEETLELALMPCSSKAPHEYSLKIYHLGEDIALSDILPVLENFGFRVLEEQPFLIQPEGTPAVRLKEFHVRAPLPAEQEFLPLRARFETAFTQVWRRNAECDRLNALVLFAGLEWKQVTMLRAYSRYLKQAQFPVSQEAIAQTLLQYPAVTALLVSLFHTRFSLESPPNRAQDEQQIIAAIEEAMAHVSNALDDRILRRFCDLMRATMRTNYYCSPTPTRATTLSFKLRSERVPELPLPKPYAEIFVYSPRVEGIHLRGGMVARGGLRWSDRAEDFRTEVLGLMKAQMVKNSVIVPVGAKGGFVLKSPPTDGSREALMQEGMECYQQYLRGLLDITDNIVQQRVVPPAHVVRYDEDDTYLVVAADKGTASFSDLANAVAKEYDFWLGDAFASGGSAGYDHKKMAITARGAFVSLQRHAMEAGIDIEAVPFSVVGIGDMSGDVFGNGMLLSRNIRLIAAFDHRHIFLDPAPDCAVSFEERQRLFNLPRSSWADYDTQKISTGGGVYARTKKTIELSPQMRQVLNVEFSTATPEQLIQAILRAPVDLLWNGGIGTYVKAEDESHEQVGDRANNAVRINGRELRCKMVVEGGNLGFTQKGRIEYARSGGAINTDAIDNSAGVDCSDHEVNIKIAFHETMQRHQLTQAARDTMLVKMTDEVAELVLTDNRLQTQAISIAQHQGAGLLEPQQRLIHVLEQRGLLDRALEFLPSDKILADRKSAAEGLSRPELAVLLAYSKMWLYRELIDSDLPDDTYFSADLVRYFPKTMREEFSESMDRHPLRREIIATVVTNSMVNRVGMTFHSELALDNGFSVRDIAAAYTIVRDLFDLRTFWAEIRSASGTITTKTQAMLYASITQFAQNVSFWLLRNRPLPLSIGHVMRDFAPGIEEFTEQMEVMHSRSTRKAYEKELRAWQELNVPETLARRVASLEVLRSACDILQLAEHTRQSVSVIGGVYFEVGSQLHLGWLRRAALRLPTNSQWERVASQSLEQEFYDEQKRITEYLLRRHSTQLRDHTAKERVALWSQEEGAAEFKAHEQSIQELQALEPMSFPALMVALRKLKSVCRL